MTVALLGRLQSAGIEVGLEDGDLILDGPVESLPDEVLDEVRAAKPALVRWLSAQNIAPRAADGEIPLSFQQQRLWFLDQLEPGSAAYILAAAFRLRGALDVARLQATLNRVIARHSALRTSFIAGAEGPVQQVASAAEIAITEVRVASEADAQGWLAAEATRPFDLATGPLLRVGLLRLGGDDHILAVTMHHIISDGWSVSVLIRDVAMAYAGGDLAPPPLDYADYATWQRGVGAGVQEQTFGFWQQTLADAPVLTVPLPDQPRPSIQRHQGASVDFTLPADVVTALSVRTKAKGATLFTVVLAGFAEVLARHTRQDDLVIGTPVANRTRPGLDEVIGFFVNMLPLRLVREPAMTVGHWLDLVRDTTQAAFAHQDMPFDRLVDMLGLERQLSHAPLFQSVLVLQTASEGQLTLPGLEITPLSPAEVSAKYDLAVTLIEMEDGALSGQLAYDTDLFLPERMQRLAGHLATLLSGLARAGNEVRIADLAMLGIEERALLTGPLAKGQVAAHEDDVSVRIMALAKAEPEAPALEYDGAVISREALDSQSNRLARALLDQGLLPGQVVGVYAPPMPGRVAAVLAIARAGGVLLPLDPVYPTERLAYICADAQPAFIISATEVVAFAATTPRIDLEAGHDSRPIHIAVPANLPAYIIYTSGSTGRPKGVSVPRQGLWNLIDWQIRVTDLSPQSRVSALARFGFDGAMCELWPTLTAGGTLVIAPAAVAGDPVALLDWWPSQKLHASYLPTPLAEQAMANGRMPEGLRYLFTGGDRLRHTPPVGADYELLDFYGPTECSVVTIAGPVVAGEGALNIGRPVRNTRIYLLDEAMNLAPQGASGEIFIAGPSLAQGYIDQPGQTAGAFLPDPFGPSGSRMYRTGDLARWLPDGRIAYLGRTGQQISLRGYRIEPGEIVAVLQEQPDVAEAFVIEDAGRLIAYLVAVPLLDVGALRTQIAARLPEYMVPSAFVVLDALPLTTNGKVDRRALPRPEITAAVHQPPATATEQIIAVIWSAVLGREGIGRQDNFFALGGHSLTATQAMSRLRVETGLDLPLRQMFEAQTLEALATRVEQSRSLTARALPPLLARADTAVLPLSFAQQRLWFLDQLEPGNPFYAIPGALRLEGTLDLDALNRAFTRLVERHESLRTRFPAEGGEARQVVDPPAPVHLPLINITDPAQIAERAEAEARRPFDLAQGPLLRASVLRMSPNDHVVLVNMHHIISDGWSMGVVVQEFAALYAAEVEGRADPLPPLQVQYADFAMWQRSWLAGERLAAEETYWQKKLDNLPQVPLQLPLDRPRPLAQSHRGATASFSVDASLTTRLRALATKQDATLFMVLNAAYAVLLARYSGQEDIAIGSPVANRREPQLEAMIGFFVNTLVLRHAVRPDTSFVDFLAEARQTALEAFDHQDLPFEHLVDLLKPVRSLDHSPIFQVSFALQNAPAPPLVLPGLTLRQVDAQALTAKFDLSLTVFERDDGLHCDVEYATDLFDSSTITRFSQDYTRMLEAITAAPATPLHALQIVSPADLAQLAKWNETDAPTPVGNVIDAFRARVAEAPDAPALRWNDLCWSYVELDRRSNRLAHALRAAGVGLGALVALGSGRGPDHIAAMLAVNKAGAAYVMLPTDAPPERLQFILSDSKVAHLVGYPDAIWPEGLTLIAPEAEGFPETPLPDLHPTRAYVVYTSGTTGQPKGSINSHAGLINKAEWYAQTYGLGPGSVCSAVSNFAFDGILAEVWPTLVAGACVVLMPTDTLRDPWLMQAVLVRESVDTMYLPMGYLETLVTTGFDWPKSLRRVLAGGDRMKGYLLPSDSGLDLVNVYGPSETQSISSVEPIGPTHEGLVSIGRPIPNVRFHILDAMLNPLPPGSVGELCIAGIGVGEGYLNRPALTADRFMPDPFGPPGSRMYRSGDMARFMPDGRVDFLGRQDGQLKIRGFRIELAEVEQALLDQPQVADCVVISQPDPKAGHRLVAYVVPRAEDGPGETHWETTFDQIYSADQPEGGDAQFDIIGWTDSYTGAPIPASEMAEWLDETIARIVTLNPRDVLEIGVGTGMILHRIAPVSENYTGTDLSQKVLDKLSEDLRRSACPIMLQHAAADDWSWLADRRFDTVILNSVAQYFPSLAYLTDWVEQAIAHVGVGHVFLGDIRHHGLAEAFALLVIDHRAEPDLTIGDLRQRVAHHLAMETELLVDPAWFFAFAAQHPKVRHVHVMPKKGQARNELIRFRYDVVLEIGEGPASAPELWQLWPGIESLTKILAAGPERLALRDIPSELCAEAVEAVNRMRQLPEMTRHAALWVDVIHQGVDPTALYTLAAHYGYSLDIGLGPGAALVHGVFRRSAQPADWTGLFTTSPRISTRHANTPFVPERNAELIASLTTALMSRLPVYMLPWRIVVLDVLPLTGNGKVDRRALPVPAGAVAAEVGPRGAVAGRIAEVWGEVLGISPDSIGDVDNFFTLGGHSLLATQVISKLRAGFGIELALRALFEAPTLIELVPVLEAALRAAAEGGGGAALPAPVAVARPVMGDGAAGGMALSFAQQRLWFLDQLDPGDAAYHLPVALHLSGPLETAAFTAALNGIVARHEVLRSTFTLEDGRAVQLIQPVARLEVPVIDLSGLPADQAEARVQAHIQTEAERPFDLGRDGMLRASLLHLGPQDHVAVVVLHHIAADGWSMGVLLREIAVLYEAALRDGTGADGAAALDCQALVTKALPPLPVQYADYAAWQRDWLQGPVLEGQLAWWRGQLQGLPGLLALPTDHPRPAVQSHRGGAVALDLSAPLVAGLTELARAQGATLHMALVALLSVLMARWSGQDDIALGTPVAGRRHEAVEGLIGFFVNTLVLRNRVETETPFATLLAEVKEGALAAQAHQDVPFEHLVEALAPARDLSHAPLFQVMLALQNAPMDALSFGGLTLAPRGFEATRTKFDLTFGLQELPGGDGALVGQIEYASDLFETATIKRLSGQFTRLAEAVIAAPETAVGRLPLLTTEDRKSLLARWQPQPGHTPDSDATLADLFAAAAAQYPDRIALRAEGESVSYSALNARANRLAHALQARGVGPDQLVGLCCDRSIEMIVGILAILKAGGAYVPLDPEHPDDRIGYMLTDAAPSVVLAEKTLHPRLQALTTAEILPLDDINHTQPSTNPKHHATKQTLAYLIYTSGSTGKPKGVMIDHRAAVRLFVETEPIFAFGKKDVWTLFHSFAFDFSVWEIFGALLYGGRLVIVPWLTSRNPEAFHQLLIDEAVTVLNQTPSAFQQLAAVRLAQANPSSLALRLVIFGGEALNRAALEPWFAMHGYAQPQLVNMYGITETTVHVTVLPLSADSQTPINIGHALPDLRLQVLDDGFEPLPPGFPGEMYVSGPGLARGYLDRAKLTAERFVPDPFGPPGSRMYRSGDLARMRLDGSFDYLGRADLQVKIRGFRIETGEIEAALAAIPGVKAAVVRARDGRLIGWHVSSHPPQQLRVALSDQLPDYMIPTTFIAIEALPLTSNGKIDLRALPEPKPVVEQDIFIAPRTPTEARLAAIWAEVLGHPISVTANFFSSGGDSMRAVTLAARARAVGFGVTVEQIFRHQTVAALALAVTAAQPVPQLPALSADDHALLLADVQVAWPTTRLQLGMLFHAELDREAGVYHDVFSHRLSSDWDETSFRTALAQLTKRHQVLRSSFDLHRFSQPLQLIHEDAKIPLQVKDLTNLPPDHQDCVIADDVAAEKARPFLSDHAPLLRLIVHLRGPNDLQLTLGLHHAILDGWSVATLQVELLEAWRRIRSGDFTALPVLQSDASASVAAEIAALADPVARNFWHVTLEGASLLTLPSPQRAGVAGAVQRPVDDLVQQALRDCAVRLGLPLRTLLLTAHLRVMALWGGTSDVTSGLVTHTRPETADGEKLLGLFLNTLPLRLKLQPESWRQMAERVFVVELGLSAHRFYPLAQIVEDHGHASLFDVMFNYIDFHVQDRVASDAAMITALDSFEATNFSLGVNAIAQGGALLINFAHDPRRVDTADVERIADTYLHVLSLMAADIESIVSVDLIAKDEVAQLAKWNDTAQVYPGEDQTLPALIEQAMPRHKDRIALSFEGENLTFGQLHARANRLAWQLRADGVGADRLVGLLCDRSIEMMVAIVAILKAGAAWVPLPPDYPAERLAMMVEDARPALVLAQPHLAHLLPGTALRLLGPEHEPQNQPDTALPLAARSDTTAYVIFTSGSTGRPKGVAVEHRAIVNRLLWMAEAYDFGPEDRVLQKTPLGFDVSVWELILPLMTGARMVIARPGGHQDVGYLTQLIHDQQVTALHFVPPMLDAFLALADMNRCRSLRTIVCSGQALARATADGVARALPQVALYNLYGPTEAAVDVTAWMHDPAQPGSTVPIGRPIANVQIHLLDEDMNPVPCGVAGGLFIGGVALARGYVNRPDLTAQAFVPSPFGPPGARLYRTGDVARWLSDGSIDYLGRLDDQVKIRGQRVEPGEVEAALLATGAREAVVMARPDPDGSMMLVAWVVGAIDEVALARRLPSHMVPQAIVLIDALPLTPNGKVDRRALPQPQAPELPQVPPRDPTEIAIAQIWANLLARESVDVTVDFFRLGGHSLSVLRMLAQVQHETGVAVSLRTFLAQPTVAGLAAAVEGIRAALQVPDEMSDEDTILL